MQQLFCQYFLLLTPVSRGTKYIHTKCSPMFCIVSCQKVPKFYFSKSEGTIFMHTVKTGLQRDLTEIFPTISNPLVNLKMDPRLSWVSIIRQNTEQCRIPLYLQNLQPCPHFQFTEICRFETEEMFFMNCNFFRA